jgi:hypothetical protein
MKKIISIIFAVAVFLSVFSIRTLAVNSPEFVNYSNIEGLVYVQLVGYTVESGEYITLEEPVLIFQKDYRDSMAYRNNYVDVFIQYIVSGMVYSFVVGLIGFDIASQVATFVRNEIFEAWGYLPPYTYNYVVDNGCYSAAFPANPFCRLAY